jgi:hypothetical protein
VGAEVIGRPLSGCPTGSGHVACAASQRLGAAHPCEGAALHGAIPARPCWHAAQSPAARSASPRPSPLQTRGWARTHPPRRRRARRHRRSGPAPPRRAAGRCRPARCPTGRARWSPPRGRRAPPRAWAPTPWGAGHLQHPAHGTRPAGRGTVLGLLLRCKPAAGVHRQPFWPPQPHRWPVALLTGAAAQQAAAGRVSAAAALWVAGRAAVAQRHRHAHAAAGRGGECGARRARPARRLRQLRSPHQRLHFFLHSDRARPHGRQRGRRSGPCDRATGRRVAGCGAGGRRAS